MKSSRLPSVTAMAREIKKARAVREAVSYLAGEGPRLQPYDALDDFIEMLLDSPDVSWIRGTDYHLSQLVNAILRQLWLHEVLVGASVVGELVYGAVREGVSDPVLDVLEYVRDAGLHSPGLVVYPVHSFGILGAGFLHTLSENRIEFVPEGYGFAVSPQTNSWDRTLDVFDRVKDGFGIKRALPLDLLEHWHRSRSLQWMTRNPLLMIRTKSFPGEYYENQFFLVHRLRQATSFIAMLAAIEPPPTGDAYIMSSSMVNNFQTLDIKHYLVLHTPGGRRKSLTGQCVPMNASPTHLAEIADLGVDLDPRRWRRRRPTVDRLHWAVDRVHRTFFETRLTDRRSKRAATRASVRMVQSVRFFRRSFRKDVEDWDAVVNLAVAFELLLTDGYQRGIGALIAKRARLALKGMPGVRKYTEVIEAVYGARGAAVHDGQPADTDLGLARRAYVYAFIRLAEALPGLVAAPNGPIAELVQLSSEKAGR